MTMTTATYTPINIPHYLRTVIAESVERGAEFLDQTNKGWFEVINQRTLELSSGEHCVLGQIGESLTDEGRCSNFSYESFVLQRDDDYFADGCKNPRVAAALVMTDAEARERGFNIHPAVDRWRCDICKGLSGSEYDDHYDRAIAIVWGLMNELWKKQIRARVAANA